MTFNKKITLNQRFKVFFVHLLYSLVLVLCALYLVYFVWYPRPLNIAVGVSSVYVMMLLIDFIIGPICTFIVYKSDKKKFIFDLFIICTLQIMAYSYGLWIMERGRPVWQVFVVDDIELVSPIDLYPTQGKEVNSVSFFESPRWVAAVYSIEPDISKKQKEDEMFDGISLATRPETYQPIETQSKVILKKLQSFKNLEQFNTKEQVTQELQKYPQAIGWLPVKAPKVDMVALFDKQGSVIKIVDLRPWL
ncbi:TfpX/TfpZ family type IV pilin accessory protein [Acinetobacter defluvii]|uniref:TfpX/TfpZ family type IV pilin accessory protein n=1 Tax=Acinetobacter defluvii TaxID=1871111 RepID=UPI003AF92513